MMAKATADAAHHLPGAQHWAEPETATASAVMTNLEINFGIILMILRKGSVAKCREKAQRRSVGRLAARLSGELAATRFSREVLTALQPPCRMKLPSY